MDTHQEEVTTTENSMESHPLWAVQVELERGMLRAGMDRYRDRVVELAEKHEMSELGPVRGLIEDWLPPCAEGLRVWIKAHSHAAGAHSIALPLLEMVDPEVSCLITLRAVLDGLTLDRSSFTRLAAEIGASVEYECQVRLWEEQEPDLFYAQQQEFDRAHATATHQRRVNINQFNSLLHSGKFGFGWTHWTHLEQFHAGKELLVNLVRVTQWFDIIPDPNHVFARGKPKSPEYVVAPKPELTAWLESELDRAEVMSPVFKPTVIPPKRWTGTRNGGYHTPYVNTPRLIRFKAHQEEQHNRAADEYDALEMPQVYDAVHFLQEVPWQVNRRVLEVVQQVYEKDLRLGKMERTQPEDILPSPAGYDKDSKVKAHVKWREKAADTYRRNRLSFSKRKMQKRIIDMAEEFDLRGQFYFPHMMDFRGRIYPIPSDLDPQGHDLARGLLLFAEGKPVDEAASGWLAVQLANMWGIDKISFDERIDWVFEHEALWRAIAKDPIKFPYWSVIKDVDKPMKFRGEEIPACDKPWQALAAVFEWVSLLDFGYGYVSHLPCAVDGTCNGIQHLSAMIRDEVAGMHVNLVPSAIPQDIYKFIAVGLQERLEVLAAGDGLPAEHARWWLDLCNNDLPRGLTKRPVMVVPYGGTRDAFFKYVREWLDKKAPPTKAEKVYKSPAWSLRSGRLVTLVTALWDIVRERIGRGVDVMEWLKKCAAAVASHNQPILWKTSADFIVRHFYGKQKKRQINTMLNGKRLQLVFQETTKKLDRTHQLLGIAPNFVHSQDAAALMLTINKAKVGGRITAFTSVHDAYGTHAANMEELSTLLREAFVELHSEDCLGEFRNACLSMLVDELVASKGMDPLEASEIASDKLPPPLKPGLLDLNLVRESNYFFA